MQLFVNIWIDKEQGSCHGTAYACKRFVPQGVCRLTQLSNMSPFSSWEGACMVMGYTTKAIKGGIPGGIYGI